MKILLIEDDEVFHAVITAAVASQGHEITIVANGDEGMKVLGSEKFDLIITDILMPNKDGIEIIQEIRESDPNVRILAISSGGRVGFSSFLKLAEIMGANACLEKPFSADGLIEKIAEAMTKPATNLRERADAQR
ncbi:MAG TPA: response regulator [Patescibacteria group bacterium]|nr:response regulator [Patescibacteria group bacterium]